MAQDADTRSADTSGIGPFGRRALLGWAALLVGAVPFLLLWLLVRRSWAPLASFDGEVAAGLNERVRGSPLLATALRWVTDVGGTGVAVLVLLLARPSCWSDVSAGRPRSSTVAGRGDGTAGGGREVHAAGPRRALQVRRPRRRGATGCS